MILIALSANLPSRYGEPPETFKHVLKALEARDIYFVRGSSLWLTSPVPYPDQPWYHNGVMEVHTDLPARDLLDVLKDIEKQTGRESAFRNASRVLDLDILTYHDEHIEEDDLIVPHPRMHERAFVLEPLREMVPHWQHPVLGQHIDDLMPTIPEDQKAKKLDIKIADLYETDAHTLEA